jgi:hypothetical protein
VRYFTGRHLTAADFRREQDYHRSHRYLHNRVFHGWGVACGLWVVEHPNAECRKDHVAVKPGIAIDCCGHEIIVCGALASPKVPWEKRTAGAAKEPVLVLCLTYREEAREKVPVIFDSGACSDPRSEYSLYEDGYSLCWKWIDPEDLLKYGWRHLFHSGPKHESPPKPRDDCKPPSDCSEEDCCQMQCPEGHCVPLAVATYKGDEITGIDTHGRPRIRPEWRHLTHVSWYNWPHGGAVPVSWLRHHGLKVTFDREVKPAVGPWSGTGINRSTFTVRYAGEDEQPDTAPSEHGPQMENPWTAVYRIDERRCRDLVGDVVFVTIRCDFVLDCHDEPVDGNHLKAQLPTGDGVAGGVFESWFSVVPDSGHQGE